MTGKTKDLASRLLTKKKLKNNSKVAREKYYQVIKKSRNLLLHSNFLRFVNGKLENSSRNPIKSTTDYLSRPEKRNKKAIL